MLNRDFQSKQAEELLHQVAKQKDAIAVWQEKAELYGATRNPIGAILLFDSNLCYLLAEGELETLDIVATASVGKTIWEALPPETCAEIEPIYRATLAGATTVTEKWCNNSLYQIRTQPIKNRQGEIFAGMVTIQNISAQPAESELKKSEARYSLLVNATSQAVWTTNREGLVVEDLPSWRSLTGQSYEDIQGWGWLNAIHPEDRQLTAQRFCDAVATKSIYQVEHRLLTADGSYRCFLARGVPIIAENGEIQEWVGTHTDISVQQAALRDRTLAEIALQDSKDSLRLALEAANLGMWDYDLISGRLWWSQQCKRLFGLIPDDSDITYDIFLNALHPEDRTWVDRAVSEAIDRKSDYDIEYRTLWNDGTLRWIAAKGRAMYDRNGQPIRMLGTTQDITDRKLIEAERALILAREQAARAESEAANRMKDEFLAIVSHELRTPLNAILGWAELLRTRQFDRDKIERAIETIRRNAKLQAQLIDDLLDISRLIPGKMELDVQQVNLISVIEAAIDSVRLAAEAKSIDLQLTTSDFKLGVANDNLESSTSNSKDITYSSRNNSPHIYASLRQQNSKFLVLGDSCRLQQIIWNLLSNAIKFTSPGGCVEVRLSIVNSSLLTVHGDRRSTVNNYAQIEVKDTGKGISADFLPYVFDRFRQADSSITRSFGGLGLGLAIARHLVELHGGTISVTSPGEGKGATFTVNIPVVVRGRGDEGEIGRWQVGRWGDREMGRWGDGGQNNS